MVNHLQPPAYGTRSLCEVLPSIADGLRVPNAWDHLGLGERDRVVLVLIDGLGHEQLHDHPQIAPTLCAADVGPITSVFPSTTPTALTSLGTGLTPGQHGLIGAVFRYNTKPFSPLSWRSEPSALAMQPETTWWQRIAAAGVAVTSCSPRQHRGGGLTGAAFRGADFIPADTVGERVAEIAGAVDPATASLVYGYWDGLDKTGHVHGVDSPHYRAELAAVEGFVTAIAAELPTGTRLIVTADHGMLDCDEDLRVDTAVLLESVHLLAGEPRVRQVYTEPGRATDVAVRWREALGTSAEVLLRDEAIAAGLFGEVAPDFRSRIGDVLALAAPGVKLTAPSRDSVVSGLRGQHGALTATEMNVPLVVIDC